jgi:hypothetical protein
MAACNTLPDVVRVPVPIPCTVELRALPEWATDKLTSTSSRFERVRALLAEREQARAATSRNSKPAPGPARRCIAPP